MLVENSQLPHWGCRNCEECSGICAYAKTYTIAMILRFQTVVCWALHTLSISLNQQVELLAGPRGRFDFFVGSHW